MIKLPRAAEKVPVSQLMLVVLLGLLIFIGLAKLVCIPLEIDEFDTFRLKDIHPPGQER